MTQVISRMRVMMTEDSNNSISSSFLLDDDSRYAVLFIHCPLFLLSVSSILTVFLFYIDFIYTFDDEHDCSIPFSVDDISKSMQKVEITDIEPPPLIRENSGFGFLLPRAE